MDRGKDEREAAVCALPVLAAAVLTDLLLRLHIQLIPRHQLKHVLQGQGQELFGQRHLYKVLVDEAVGRIVQHSTHHSLGKLAHTQAIFGMKPMA